MGRNVSEHLLIEEQKIQKGINTCIDQNRSFIFDASAGTGKTYALIETIRYIIREYGDKLENSQQQIMCITYTNVAKDEIKVRLGKSRLVDVSTIHDFLWGEIKIYQEDLIKVHKNFIQKKIEENKNEFHNNSEKQRFIDYYQKLFRDDISTNDYNKHAGLSATEFRTYISKVIKIYKNDISNVQAFKKKIRFIKDYSRLKKALNDIMSGSIKEIIYDSRSNMDRLHDFKISHDTVLQYATEVFSNRNLICKIKGEKYPYILIDEYQDTQSIVVEILDLISSRSITTIGYFGDYMQKIYENGIGKINNKNGEFRIIEKTYSRRSSDDVLKVASKISKRNEISIYKDNYEGKVDVLKGDLDTVITLLSKEYKPLHICMLRHIDVAKHYGFEKIIDFYLKSPLFRGANYSLINTQLLGRSKKDYNPVTLYLYNLYNFYLDLKNKKLFLSDTTLTDINMQEVVVLGELLNNLEIDKITSLRDFLVLLQDAHNLENTHFNKILDCKLSDYIPFDQFNVFLLEHLFAGISDEDDDYDKKITLIKNFLEIPFEQIGLWYNYVNKKYDSDITYHTFHSTKGEEYENVLMVIDDKFAGKDNYFKSSLKEVVAGRKDYTNILATNLLYVVTTRAIKNLFVYYAGSDPKTKELINQIYNIN